MQYYIFVRLADFMDMCYGWLQRMRLHLISPLTSQSIQVCSSGRAWNAKYKCRCKWDANKDQRWPAVMVKGPNHLCACSQDRLHTPALTSSVPAVDGNNGFALCCQHLTERVCQQALSAVSLCDLTRVCWSGITAGFAGNHSWQHSPLQMQKQS